MRRQRIKLAEITMVITNVCNVSKVAVATRSSAQQELLQQADEIDFILRHFVERSCQGFKPSSSDKSVYIQPLSSSSVNS